MKRIITSLLLALALPAFSEPSLAVMETAFGYRTKVESVALAKEAGYQGVQLHTGSLNKENVLTLSDPELQEQFLAASKEHGIDIVSLCAGSLNRLVIWKEGKPREEALAIMKQSLAACEALGCDVLLFPFFGPSNFTKGEEKIAGVAKFTEEILPLARQHGVTIGIESPIPYKRVLELFERLGNPKELRMYYDTGNMMRAGEDIYAAIEEMGNDLICEIHIKPEGNIHFGKDKTDLPRLAATLDKIGYDKSFLFEARGGVKNGKAELAAENRKGMVELLSLRKKSDKE
ncbi:MAG: sugar phosphate isomerase/epimerase family protein [Roseibacillus sp.]